MYRRSSLSNRSGKQPCQTSCLRIRVHSNGVRYKKALQSARTKAQAEEAERKELDRVHEGLYGKPSGSITFKEFSEKVYLPWAKENKRSWQMDVYRLNAIYEFFGHRRLRDISPFLVESYRIKRLKTPVVSKKKTKKCWRAP